MVGGTTPEIVRLCVTTELLLPRRHVQTGMRPFSNVIELREPSSKPSKSQTYFDSSPEIMLGRVKPLARACVRLMECQLHIYRLHAAKGDSLRRKILSSVAGQSLRAGINCPQGRGHVIAPLAEPQYLPLSGIFRECLKLCS